ncbi:MAG: 2,3-bisphosphoglycerate-independent phosphoglycerate mutase [Acidobacteria bacterium]|nr:hypothetical protein [Acidobacteriota bacterium]MCB9398765.1 2,3-bisphosphoglycerate-independent phosphoglycerate mutase [Acidobacteriota bacterium]
MTALPGLVLILDGLGDRPSPRLHGKTPLEAAETPNLDFFAAQGLTGMVNHLAPWVPVGTHIGAGLLMGLRLEDAQKLQRGPVEAAGIGLDMAPGDVALRCNLAHVRLASDRFEILDRRAGRIEAHVPELCTVLNQIDLGTDYQVEFRPATQHRVVCRLRGPQLSALITNTDPGAGQEELGALTCQARRIKVKGAVQTAKLVNQLVSHAHRLLADHPVNTVRRRQGLPEANGLLIRGAGKVQRLVNLLNLMKLKVALVSGEGTLLGLARLFGFETVVHPRFTASHTTDLAKKIEMALQATERKDLVFLHIKATDTLAHDLNPEGKRDFLERIDQALDPLRNFTGVIAISGDHTTDSNTGRHTGDPVPSLLWAENCRRDDSREFGERQAFRGGLGQISAQSFLAAVLDHMGALHNYQFHDRLFF